MGDTELFSIDRKTGMIRTLKALDREMIARHELTVGTEENNSQSQGATTTVEVFVDVSIKNRLCVIGIGLQLIRRVQCVPSMGKGS